MRGTPRNGPAGSEFQRLNKTIQRLKGFFMSKPRIALLALALAALSTPALAAGARTSVANIKSTGVTSVAAAAIAAPSNPSLPDDGAVRDSGREKAHEDMVNQLISDRVGKLGAAARAAALAPPTLPHVPGSPLGENENSFGFRGLSNVDQSNVNLGFSVEPPDQALCVGNGFVFEGVNDAFAVYDQHGVLLAGPAQANAFFNVDFSLNVSDPKCLYDPATDRWFVTMTEYDNFLSDNHIKIAVSQTGDPRGAFNVYDINVTGDGSDFIPGGQDCPCLGDQPLIGADANAFYVSTNAFGGLSFEGAQIYAISKSALAAGTASPPAVHFDQLSFLLPDIEFSYSIQPAMSPPGAAFAANTEYLAQSMRALKLEQRLAVFTVNNTYAINGDRSQMSVSATVTPSQVYVQPVPARQKAGPTPRAEIAAITDSNVGGDEQSLDGNDQRMSQLTYLNGQLWTTVGTASTTKGAPVRDAVAWFVINVTNPASGPTASIASQGYVAGPDSSHLIYPALAVNARGDAAVVFTLTGPQFFPSAAFWKFGAHSLHMLAEGAAPQDGFSAYDVGRPRWGDYSAAAVGPNGDIWMATEMIPNGARKSPANWGTFIGRTHQGEQDD